MKKLEPIKLRNKAKHVVREYEAIIILTNRMTIELKNEFSEINIKIDTLDNKQLLMLIDSINREAFQLRNHFGVRVDNSFLVELADDIENAPGKNICYVAKYLLEDCFKRYNRVFRGFNGLPYHAKIGIDPGRVREKHGQLEVFILEASIFEDMCALFNLSKEKAIIENSPNINADPKLKIANKIFLALCHATVITAFNLLEAYLNAIAFCYYVTNFPKLDDKSRMILTEWDHIHQKHKFMSLRDKALQYPKIFLGRIDPPLVESNCEELSFILERAKALRDSIVHASPFPINGVRKEDNFLQLKFNEVEKIVDYTIKLIRKIEYITRGDDKHLSWLFDRRADGFFLDEVFK